MEREKYYQIPLLKYLSSSLCSLKPYVNTFAGVELIPFGATFFSCLLINIEYGIMIGVQVHLLLLAYDASRSKISCVRIEVAVLQFLAVIYLL